MTKTLTTMLLCSVAARAVAFDAGKTGWKLDADGKLAMDANGNPIYVAADGAEMATEPGTIARLNGESKQHREAKERAEASLKKFEGLDPEKARSALETVGKLDSKSLIDAGKVDEVKQQMSAQYEAQLTEAKQTNAALQTNLDNMTKATTFAKSKFIAERIAVPPEMFEATFGSQFKVEDGKVVPYGRDGNPIYSKKRMGEIADVDEAFEIIVDAYPHKDTILKAQSPGGTGGGGGGGQRGVGRVVRRADFDAMSPADKQATMQATSKGEMQVVD